MAAIYTCPHCGEEVDTDPDPGGGAEQDYIEDCPVCCRANRIVASLGEDDGDYAVQAFAEILRTPPWHLRNAHEHLFESHLTWTGRALGRNHRVRGLLA